MEALLRSFTVPQQPWWCRGHPTADWPNPRWHCRSFELAQSVRRDTAKVRGFDCFPRCYTAINGGTSAEPRRSLRCHCDLCRISTAVVPHLRCDGDSTAEARRNMVTVSAVPPRRSAVLIVFRGATAINDGTSTGPR